MFFPQVLYANTKNSDKLVDDLHFFHRNKIIRQLKMIIPEERIKWVIVKCF